MTSSEPDPDTAETPRDVDPQGESARDEDLREDPRAEPEQPAQQAQAERTDQPVPADPARRPGGVGPLVCLGAAVLTVAGSILDLLTAQNLPAPGEPQTISFTSWTADMGGDPGQAQPIPLNGVPLMAAVAILLVAAVTWMLAASRARARSLVAVVTAVAAAFLAGAVTTVGVQVWWWLDLFAPPEFAPATDITVTVGPGFWLLVAAVGLAVIAAVLAWPPSRTEPAPAESAQAEPARTEPDTPAEAASVVVRRLPDAPPDDPPAPQGS